jgi:hypothetical protein
MADGVGEDPLPAEERSEQADGEQLSLFTVISAVATERVGHDDGDDLDALGGFDDGDDGDDGDRLGVTGGFDDDGGFDDGGMVDAAGEIAGGWFDRSPAMLGLGRPGEDDGAGRVIGAVGGAVGSGGPASGAVGSGGAASGAANGGLFELPGPPPLAGAGRPRDDTEEAPVGRAELKVRLRRANRDAVRTIARRTGRSHAEINAELNRLAGVTSVASATVAQLERRLRAAEEWRRRTDRSTASTRVGRP